MATCSDNPRLGRIGCGQTYGGEMQHSVAKVSWSQHADGMAHVTGRLSTIEKCWAKGDGEMANPADLGFHQDARGVWRQPGQRLTGDCETDCLRAGVCAYPGRFSECTG